MLPVQGYYLYKIGSEIHPLMGMKSEDTLTEWQIRLLIAKTALYGFLNNSIFSLQTCRETGDELLGLINKRLNAEKSDDRIGDDAIHIENALTAFETVLNAELASKAIYLVLPKGGYDTTVLIGLGRLLFPPEIPDKVPESIKDLDSGTKCIAFRLFTAAGFHLHRANEAVLHRYWDSVTDNAQRPKNQNLGICLKELENRATDNSRIDKRLLASLRDLKDLHRNPLIHPEQSIDDLHEAIALLNAIHGTITWMLKQIPESKQD